MILRLGGTVRRRDSSSFTSLETAPRPRISWQVRPCTAKLRVCGWSEHLHLIDSSDEELAPGVVLHLEGQPAGEHAVEADTQGPHVHGLAVGHRLVVDLRSSVLGRSTASLELGAWVPEVAQPEVSDDDFGVILVQKDVFELDVSVNDLLGVEVADSR